jgi:hypothetical protein
MGILTVDFYDYADCIAINYFLKANHSVTQSFNH